MPRPCPRALTTALACWLAACGADEPTSLRPNARPDAEARAWLVDRSATAGLGFVCATGARGAFHLPEIMGGGIAVFDADGDDVLDLYLTQSGPDRFLLGRAGDAGPRFVDATAAAGLATPGHSMGVAVGDVDGDGDLDLYVTRVGPDRFYRNRGDGTFEDRTRAAGLGLEGWSTSAAFFDWNGDGQLDLWVCRYVELDPDEACTGFLGAPDYCGPLTQPALSDALFTNLGDGRFRDDSARAGLTLRPQPGLGVVCEDLDGDGRVDVFVANDASPNQLWRNLGDGSFREVAHEWGVATDGDGALEAGMGVVAADLDGDGAPDLFLTHLRGETNTLYAGLRARARGRFEDVTAARGLAGPSQEFTGFGVAAFDLECDGDLDLAIANGHVNRGPPNPYSSAPAPWNEFAEPDHLLVNDGSGRFTPAPRVGAGLCRNAQTSRGLVAADLDRDGDLDLLVVDLESPPRVIVNEAPRRGRFLAVQVRGPGGRVEVLGARVTVQAGGRAWTRTVTRASGFLSSADAEQHFGLGPVGAIEALSVRWPDGAQESFAPPPTDARVVLVRGTGVALD